MNRKMWTREVQLHDAEVEGGFKPGLLISSVHDGPVIFARDSEHQHHMVEIVPGERDWFLKLTEVVKTGKGERTERDVTLSKLVHLLVNMTEEERDAILKREPENYRKL